MSAGGTVARFGPRARAATLWLLFTAVASASAAEAARLTWRLAAVRWPVPAAPPTAVADAPDADSAARLDPIRALAPFGRPEAAAAAPQAARETRLRLSLAGVVVAPDPERSSAMIAVGTAAPARFEVGERVGERAVLRRVDRGEVLLDVGGAPERLRFPEPGRSRATEAARAVIPGLAAAAGPAAGGAGAAPSTGGATGGADAVELWRRRIDDNPATVLHDLGLVASPEGYRVGASGDPGVRRAGLRPGDVVARVNGRPVGDVARDRALVAEVIAEGRARIDVLRDGRTLTLSFPLR